jgi:hypothetical protein
VPFGGFFIQGLIFFGSFKKLHFIEATMERASTDAEFFCGLAAVSSTAFECLENEICFRIADV